MRVHIGTSGYNYPEWKGSFYPEKIKSAEMFGFYAAAFKAVEINATFYRMPTPKMTEAWRDQAPDGFRYALKAPRRITHDARLRDCADSVGFFVDAARLLDAHRGPLLFQLPPNLKCDLPRLETFLSWLPTDVETAFEFRHESWLSEEVYAALNSRGVALCIADFGDHHTPVRPTARHGYFRLRDEGYTTADLERWAEVLKARSGDWDDAFVFFKHEEAGKGPAFAREFREILGRADVTVA